MGGKCARSLRHRKYSPISYEPADTLLCPPKALIGSLNALVHERWPRWFPQREFLTIQRPSRPLVSTESLASWIDRSHHLLIYLASSGIGSARLHLMCSPWLANL